MELSKLAEKDPEFFKYLQENDRELLEFDPATTSGVDDGEDDMDVDQDATSGDRLPTLTDGNIRKWQRALLEVNILPYHSQ